MSRNHGKLPARRCNVFPGAASHHDGEMCTAKALDILFDPGRGTKCCRNAGRMDEIDGVKRNNVHLARHTPRKAMSRSTSWSESLMPSKKITSYVILALVFL